MRSHLLFVTSILILTVSSSSQPQTLRQAAEQRAIPAGAAADASENGCSSDLLITDSTYSSTLAAQYSMLEPENAMKWAAIHPRQGSYNTQLCALTIQQCTGSVSACQKCAAAISQCAYNFQPGDELVLFGQANGMRVRGHNLVWDVYNPTWINNLAATGTPAQMSAALQDHITTVVSHYQGQVFAWDVVNEAVSDSPQPATGTLLKDSIWYDQPGIGVSGTGYVEQAFRWARAADPNALLFYNDYGIEDDACASGRGKFQGVYNMVADFVSRGVPINGVGFQMHIDTSGCPTAAGFAAHLQKITALGLQAHITEMDVKIPVDSNGNATGANLQAQAATYQRILTVCLQTSGCTAFQTWGFTDKHSWLSGQSEAAALPFDVNYQPKPAFGSLMTAFETVPPVLSGAAIVNAASYQGGSVAPGELITIFGANYGPATLTPLQLGSNNVVSSNLAGTQVLFDGTAAPLVYSLAGQVSAVVPYEVAGETGTVVEYQFNGVNSNTVTVPVSAAMPGIFAADASGKGPGAILNQDSSLNTAANPAAAGSVIVAFATGGGTVQGGATDGALAPAAGAQSLPVTATIGGLAASVQYAGPAPGEVNGVMQVNIAVPAAVAAGNAVAVVIAVGEVWSNTVTIAVK
jgi:endo-1,4-beta-xylanase